MLRNFARVNGLDEEILEIIFDPLEIILDINTSFLEELHVQVREWEETQTIGSFLEEWVFCFIDFSFFRPVNFNIMGTMLSRIRHWKPKMKLID